MPRGTHLDEEDKLTILYFASQGKRDPNAYGKTKRPGDQAN
ncbi:hypothetical protein H310_10597 [Aphanomyces invadans]|uniref:Uncharacterized protein n=1 Tax=Aphanomyces invadans TaxID=157072 RepID=A0A024TPK6_9STRA|nr:hypothetical protein H310_10597 [Aphanomyces invadans]ETV95938.1 hypothetical protein H310_10597 [Aphanomyces invadans]|eukprot:XP_008875249.1 hypothetical protein H310_10597 [Aphanomyces invadans]